MAPPSSFLAATAERCRLPGGVDGGGGGAQYLCYSFYAPCATGRRRQKEYSSIASFRTAVVRNLQAVTDSSAHHNPGEALTEIYFILT